MADPTPPPETPRPDAFPPDDEPSPSGPARRSPERGEKALLGTLIFIIAVVLMIFSIGIGGLGLLLMLVFAAAWPLAAPGILLYVVAFCLPASLTIWIAHRAGKESSPLRLPGPLP